MMWHFSEGLFNVKFLTSNSEPIGLVDIIKMFYVMAHVR